MSWGFLLAFTLLLRERFRSVLRSEGKIRCPLAEHNDRLVNVGDTELDVGRTHEARRERNLELNDAVGDLLATD